MEEIVVEKLDEVFMRVITDAGVKYEISDYFTFTVPNAKFHPLVKSGRWDGKIRLFNPLKGYIHIGLLENLSYFCNDRNYKLTIPESLVIDNKLSTAKLAAAVEGLNIHSRGKKINVTDYQHLGIHEALNYKRRVILSSTGSGKSAIIYAIARILNAPTLIICPTTSLVEQMDSDFADYASEVDWSTEENVHKIYSGKEKETNKPIVISTWQSLMRMPKEWFSRFKCVINDEVHLAKSTEITKIMEKCEHAEYRIGLTGSLDKSQTHKLMIQALFGTIIKVSSTKDLIDRGHLSDIRISALVLDYPDEVKSQVVGFDYKQEIDFLIAYEKRNKFIRNLALSLKRNTLILFTYVEKHGQVLYEMIKEKNKDKQVFYIHGNVDVEDRERYRHIAENSDNVIIIASFATFSTGVNLKNLHNIVFASPTKSMIRVLQSLGRGLRKAEDKTHMTLYDICDKLTNRKRKNFAYKHFVERLDIYSKEQFDYKIIEVTM